MLDGTYAGMEASIADFLNRTDLSASIPDFVTLAEAQLNRQLRTRLAVLRSQATVSTQFLAMPPDFQTMISIVNVLGQPLDQYSQDAMSLLTWENANLGGNPTAFCIIGTTVQFFPIPSTAQTVIMSYRQRIPPLALNPTGNWVSLSHPDAYLYGALVAASPYLQDDDRVSVWGGLFETTVSSILDSDLGTQGERLTPQPSVSQII